MRIGILLFDGVDLLDSGGPYEVFLTASRLAARDGGGEPFDVVTLSPGGRPVTAYGGLGLSPALSCEACGPLEALVVPGTIDVERATADRELIAAIRATSARSALTASVCTGAFLLAAAGILEPGTRWTTHWEDIDGLAARLGPHGAARGVRWVDAGTVVTAAGLSSGIAMALHLVDRLAGRPLAQRTARQIDYAWDPADGVSSPRSSRAAASARPDVS